MWVNIVFTFLAVIGSIISVFIVSLYLLGVL